MDLFPTFLELANISLPVDRVFDGRSLVSSILHNKTFDRLLGFKCSLIVECCLGSENYFYKLNAILTC